MHVLISTQPTFSMYELKLVTSFVSDSMDSKNGYQVVSKILRVFLNVFLAVTIENGTTWLCHRNTLAPFLLLELHGTN